MAPARSALRALAPLCLAALVASCDGAEATPAIAFTYNWGEPGILEFLQSEVDRVSPPGSPPIRVIDGRSVDFLSKASSPLAAEVNRAAYFAEDPSVIVAVGPGGSREALQVAPVYRRARLAHLVPTATSRLLKDAGDWTFLMAPNDSLQGEFIGAFADTALGATRAAIVYVPDEYGVGLAAGTEATLRARGIALLDRVPVRPGVECETERGRARYRGIVAELGASGSPDVVITALRSTECACLLVALRARWPAVDVITGDGAYVDDDFLRRAGRAADGTYYVAFWHHSLPGASEGYVSRFTHAVQRAPRHGDAVFYDGVMLAAQAIRERGADRERVRAYLRELGQSRPAYDGIAGPVAFTPAIRRELLMTEVVGGAVRVVGSR